MIFLLNVCHVDKRVAGVENMNNPWSKDVYPAAWSWETIIQLGCLCQSHAVCFFRITVDTVEKYIIFLW